MHDVDHKGFRHALVGAGMGASLIFLLASMWANYRYGYSLAKTATDGVIYGAAAAACDVLMAAAPFYFFAAKRNRAWTQMLASAAVWAVMTTVAAVSAISQTSVNRIDAISARTTKTTSYADTRSEIEKARQDRGFIPQHRPVDTVKADIQGWKAKPQWNYTSECQEASGKSAREFCQNYYKLNAELGYATQAAKLDERIATLVEKSDKAAENNIAVASEADPGAKSLSVMSGYDVRSVQSGIVGLVALMFLVGAGLGPYISWSLMETDRRRITTIDAEPIESAPADAVKIEATKAPLALPKPAEPIQLRAEPSAEWRALLDAIDFPRGKKPLGALRPRDKREHLGWRWYVWINAHSRTGTFTGEDVERLYDEYVGADHREKWGANTAKGELRSAARKFISVQDSRSPTTWKIEAMPLARLRDRLIKYKVIPASPTQAAPAGKQEVAGESGAPFVSAASGAPIGELPEPANDAAPAPKKAVTGMAQLSRHMPDLRAMGTLGRVEKLRWQARMILPNRKSLNRFSRARGTA